MTNEELAYNLRNSIEDCLDEEFGLYLNGEYGNFDKEKFFDILRKETAAYIDDLEEEDNMRREWED